MLIVAALSACAPSGGAGAPPVPAATPAVVSPATAAPSLQAAFSQQQAVDAAVAQAKGDPFDVSQEAPHDPQAELLTQADAYHRLSMEADAAPGQAQGGAVWLVTLQGTWQSGGATLETYHHYWVILDANSGALVTYTVGP